MSHPRDGRSQIGPDAVQLEDPSAAAGDAHGPVLDAGTDRLAPPVGREADLEAGEGFDVAGEAYGEGDQAVTGHRSWLARHPSVYCFQVLLPVRRRPQGLVAYSSTAKPPGGQGTWPVVDRAYRTAAPLEEWLEAHRTAWSPNTVRSYTTALAQWWSFLEQRDAADEWRRSVSRP